MSTELGKKLFKNVYNEDPTEFKKDISDGINQKVLDYFEFAKKTMNEKDEESEEENNEESEEENNEESEEEN